MFTGARRRHHSDKIVDLELSQEMNQSQEEATHCEQHWRMVVEVLKTLLES
jgi:hypothetical protein